MKSLIISLIFVLSGCDNFIHGRQGPVVVKMQVSRLCTLLVMLQLKTGVHVIVRQ